MARYFQGMLRINPHIHSACSGGIGPPPQLMVGVARTGLNCVGLSDYDTFAGQDEAEAAISFTGAALIRDMEMSCAANGISVHLLILLPDPSNEGFLTCIERARESRATRALKMVENPSADYLVTREQVLAFAPEEGPIGRPHIADTLVVVGIFDDRSAAFMKVLHPSSPYYVRYWAPDPTEAVQLALEVGGVPVLAHLKARACQQLLFEFVIGDMKEVGLFGIKCDYRDHTPEDREAVGRTAKHLDLRVFGPSNYHDAGKPNRIGENLTAPAIIGETMERAHLEVLHPWLVSSTLPFL